MASAVPGFGDYLTIGGHGEASVIATVHMVLNVAVAGLFVVARRDYSRDGATSGRSLTLIVVLHGAGVGLLAVSGRWAARLPIVTTWR